MITYAKLCVSCEISMFVCDSFPNLQDTFSNILKNN